MSKKRPRSKNLSTILLKFKHNGQNIIIEKVGTLGQSADGKVFLGQCDPPLNAKKRKIKIVKRAKGRLLLELLIHELLHLYAFDLPETTVDRYANKLANILWKMGYRDMG